MLVGLVLNSTLGSWWADPIVALGLAVVAVREGREALRGQTCCPPVRLDEPDEDGDGPADGCGCTAPGCGP